jgi:adenylosuccinate lyase
VIHRYQDRDINSCWSEQLKYARWLAIEAAVAQKHIQAGRMPAEAMELILDAKTPILEITNEEDLTQHDVVAFLNVVRRQMGEHGKYLHYGLTSSDLVDTALAQTMRGVLEVLLQRCIFLNRVLVERATAYRNVVLVARTHGQAAQRTTLDHVLLGHAEQVKRAQDFIRDTIVVVSYGKFSGAVGTNRWLSAEDETHLLSQFGLQREPLATQVVGRDRHFRFACALANLAVVLGRFALRIRLAQQTGIDELREPRLHTQVGSSAMPHKRNPTTCEKICGLARYVSSQLPVVASNVMLWGERDISHSSVERIVLPDMSHAVAHMLQCATEVAAGLEVDLQSIDLNVGLLVDSEADRLLHENT